MIVDFGLSWIVREHFRLARPIHAKTIMSDASTWQTYTD